MTVNGQRDEFAEEIFEFSSYSRFCVDAGDGTPKCNCDCLHHDEDDSQTIREGNLVSAILVRKDPPEYYSCDHPIWVVEYVACYDCKIASLYERVDKESAVAVVEGEATLGDDCLTLEPRYIWDLHIPTENSAEI